MRSWLRPSTVTLAGLFVVIAATGITAACSGGISSISTPSSIISGGTAATSGSAGSTGSKPAASSSAAPAALCEQLLVPAYFAAPYWETAIKSKYKPKDMILDISGLGAGSAPKPQFQTLVKQAQAAGITVLGYSSTVNGQRPVAEIEADVRHYAAWYGVTSIFLDRVAGTSQLFSYYSQIAAYIHGAHQGAEVWLNPGVYPADQNYMSIGNVVMVFEGTYAQYLTRPVPGWAKSYPADRFSHTIYATPAAVLHTALKMAQQKNAGYVYVTDLVGSNPYQGLPSYWSAEVSAATAGCTAKTG